MRALLLAVMLISGCTSAEHDQTTKQTSSTTVYRYVSQSCEAPTKPAKADDTELRRMTKSRDEWRRYAERLELLSPKDAEHAPHP